MTAPSETSSQLPQRQLQDARRFASTRGTKARQAHTHLSFCKSNAISESQYYSLKRQGKGPREIELDGRIIITREAEADWRREREAETARNKSQCEAQGRVPPADIRQRHRVKNSPLARTPGAIVGGDRGCDGSEKTTEAELAADARVLEGEEGTSRVTEARRDATCAPLTATARGAARAEIDMVAVTESHRTCCNSRWGISAPCSPTRHGSSLTHIACVGGITNKNNTEKPTIRSLSRRDVEDEGAIHE